MQADITIRIAKAADIEEILAIYAPYVKETAITLNIRCRPLKNSESE